MKEILCPMDELVETDLAGYLEGDDFEEESFGLDGKAVE